MLTINEDHAQLLCMPVALAAIYNYYYNDQINSISHVSQHNNIGGESGPCYFTPKIEYTL